MSWIQYDPRLTRTKIQLPPLVNGEMVANAIISTVYKNPPHVITVSDIAEAKRCESGEEGLATMEELSFKERLLQ